ncbi:MAG: M28 family peptidase [Verrucomicrobia bacterium]|nr:M28 family peptidase [Verrucomicrobiota bacterium]MBV8375588.1 M28 family peptidase [Verrucomicrobiota bacterium]
MQPSASVTSGTPPPHRERIWSDFDGQQALAEARTLTDFGPRPSGSEANKKLRQHLVARLTRLGWQTSEQRLTEKAPDGREIEFCNIIARFSRYPASAQRVLLGAHFDTPPTQEFQDPGASDGGANTAVLMEVARTLTLDPQLAGSVELFFLDGHSPFQELTLDDGLFGSRFSAQMIRIDHRAGEFRAAILLNNIGGASLDYPPNSDPGLANALKKAAAAIGVKLKPANRSLLADHLPFAQAGIPSIALLDADFPFLNTADDTVDHLDADSLAKTGKLILYFIVAEATTQ